VAVVAVAGAWACAAAVAGACSSASAGGDGGSRGDGSVGDDATSFGDAASSRDANHPADANDPGDGGAPGDPATDGAYDVLEADDTAGSATVTVYAPSTDGGQHVAAGRFALVVVSPGFQMARTQYATYAHRLATHGFIAIAQDFGGGFTPDHQADAVQTSAVIDWAIAGGGGRLDDHVDEHEIGVAGHSMGGKVSILAATEDARIRAVVGWDPVDSGDPSVTPEKMGALHAALVLLGETTDASGGLQPCAPTADDYAQYYASAGSPALSITVTGADHMDFVDDTGCLLCGFCSPGSADASDVHALASRTTVAAFRRYLRGEVAMDRYLTGSVIEADQAAGKVTVASK
jgi:dienelactone hydrolase